VRIQLAHDAQCLHLRADVREARPVVHDEVAPDHPAFWRQDHIEFRLLPDVKADLEQVQFILAASGRVFDSLGLWRRPDAAGLRFAGGPTAGGWQVTLSVPAARLGWRDGGASGCQAVGVLRGLVAYCRWTDGARDIACATPAALGFPHAERFAEFVFQPSIRGLSPQSADEPFLHTRLEAVRMAPGPLAVGLNRATLELHNRGPEAVAGHVRVEAHDGLGAVARTQRVPARLAPGLSSVDVLLELARPRYTRFEVWFERDGTAAELGAFTLRGAPPPFTPRRPLQHPYLLFDADGLEHLRAKLARPFSAESATDLSRPAPTRPTRTRSTSPRPP